MTTRIAIFLFLASFASITCWLLCREPADRQVAVSPPSPTLDKTSADTVKPDEKTDMPEEPVALSDIERDIKNKLTRITIPSIDVDNVNLTDVLQLLTLKLREIEGSELSGLNFMVRYPIVHGNNDATILDQEPVETPNPRITIQETNATFAQILDLVCEQSGHRWSIEEHVIVLNPLS